jgi:hypothetical protein
VAKKPAPPQTLEQRIEEAIARDLHKSYATSHLPIPATKLEVGQEVFLGHIEDAVIVKIIDQGRRVAVKYTPPKAVGGGSDGYAINVVPAFDVQVKSMASSENFGKPNKYMLHYSQRDVSGLMTMVTHFGVDMDPPYQRGLVWEEADKVKLIDSMFKIVDIGKFVFRKLPFASDAPSYEIVDGKQRLNAIIEFMSDGFSYQGKTWSQLSQSDRGFIDNYSVSYAQLAEALTDQEVMELFVRLNTGGRPVDPAHLEKVERMAQEQAIPKPAKTGPKS